MAEQQEKNTPRDFRRRHRGRMAQIPIYLGKMLRMFLYQNDWKVLPMAALISGMLGMVLRGRMFVTMEGTLMGAFAIACVCIWNGCFNAIQVICRERDVIKREHRAGMHISSYVAAHMLYQAFICIAQTVITVYVTQMTGVNYNSKGVVTNIFIIEFCVTVFLITYAADLMALWLSALCRSTTTAMTVMPFILIFQLIFSGGMFSLPAWAEPLSALTISASGMDVISAQADRNNRPSNTVANLIDRMEDSEISGEVTLGQVLDLVVDEDMRAQKVAGDATVGDIADLAAESPGVQKILNTSYPYTIRLGDLIDIAGKKNVKDMLEKKAAEAGYSPDYERTALNIIGYWFQLLGFIIVFAVLTVITLEFIDKDKR